MNDSALRRRLLQALATASQSGETIDLIEISAQCGEPPLRLLRAFQELRALGLVHPHRLRLTLAGLAVAVACGAMETPAQRERLPAGQAATLARGSIARDAINAL
jgi:hypothetical protein